ncbi:hypothetical protein D9V28_08340 [Mycetocola zhadangensis]|uniref:Uncharacterized protein n=1 Tax=Mycetocola zhadangensis TaxID=1164595 RepID=A0A3L7J131_9MICO|nr:hypothetical protein D9V28_08340 [Mycetocola zhadangensis]
MILHAVIRSAVSQGLQRHALWHEGRAVQTAAAESLESSVEPSSEGNDWTLDIRGTSYTVRPQSMDLWSVMLEGQPTHTVRRDARGFFADGSSRRFGTLEEVIRDARRVR